MKKIFWSGLSGLFLFELANVYFIMPMPAYQEFWHSWRTFNPDTKK